MKSYMRWLRQNLAGLYAGLLLLMGLSVYLTGYWYPKGFFWDENYHIASAQKIIDRVAYMESHPPLGKQLMALSEWLTRANSDVDKSAFTRVDYIQNTQQPANLQFYGFRLPSALGMALCPLLLFGILCHIVKRPYIAFIFSLMLIFDNALVVHGRAAMLEGIQLFFLLLSLFVFVRVMTLSRDVRLRDYCILALCVGATMMVKVNGAILLVLFPVVYFFDQRNTIADRRWFMAFKRLVSSASLSVATLLTVFLAVFYVHIGMGETVKNASRYKMSKEYQENIVQGKSYSLSAFYWGVKDNLKYMASYADGVPVLDMCKEGGENGSPVGLWPLGGKGIKYRWGSGVEEGEVVNNYLYLLGNPFVWLSVLAGVFLSSSLVVARVMFRVPIVNFPLFRWAMCFTGLYVTYMLVVAQIERVMYLYHYFIPLVFGVINLSVIVSYIFNREVLMNSLHFRWNLFFWAVLFVSGFAWFSVLTFGVPITEAGFEARNWFNFWLLEPEVLK